MTALSLALASDAFAVSVGLGFSGKNKGRYLPLKLGLYFGLFQAVMPLGGWQTGKYLLSLISGIGHWAAFLILSAVGVKLVWESFGKEKEKEIKKGYLLLLAIATSIDAFAVGLTFSYFILDVFKAVAVIGAITFTMSYCGFYIGKKFGKFAGKKAELTGGLILILIGVKILFEHLLKG